MVHKNKRKHTIYVLCIFFLLFADINRLNTETGKHHHQPIYSCGEAETWAWLSRMVDRGRGYPFKNWHSPVVLGIKDAVLSLSLWQCQAELSSLQGEINS